MASIATAPEPSPKRIQLLLSCQSTKLDSWSAPITIALLKLPPFKNFEAVIKANKKPLHAAVKSKATALAAPNLAWMDGADQINHAE